jgi:hypothetical protein
MWATSDCVGLVGCVRVENVEAGQAAVPGRVGY